MHNKEALEEKLATWLKYQKKVIAMPNIMEKSQYFRNKVMWSNKI